MIEKYDASTRFAWGLVLGLLATRRHAILWRNPVTITYMLCPEFYQTFRWLFCITILWGSTRVKLAKKSQSREGICRAWCLKASTIRNETKIKVTWFSLFAHFYDHLTFASKSTLSISGVVSIKLHRQSYFNLEWYLTELVWSCWMD